MFKHRRTTLERIDKFISPLYFKDVNLFGQLYGKSRPFDQLEHLNCGLDRPPFKDAIKNSESKYGKFSKAVVGQTFGPTWSTHWFKIKVTIPDDWHGKEVHLRWDAGCEALLWSEDGSPLQGLSGDVHERTDFILPPASNSLKILTYYVEMACNTPFGAGGNGMIAPPDPNKSFVLKTAEITIFDRKVYYLLLSLKCLYDIANELPETNPRGFDALYAGNDVVNALQREPGLQGIERALSISNTFFSKRNGETQHQIVAVGHCHIDCAWLWPYDETIRKCARSWASTLELMDRYSTFNFSCSQAQQFEWVKDHYPKLYERIKVAVGNNRFIPVGGTWVEMDGNLPSGESFVRQFLYGQIFFQKEFGKMCKEFWLPDTFGYSPQLPQIMKQCGIKRFLTQKISWSLVNKFPHHNFLWEGIDGSSVIAHFPPGDSYEMKVEVKEALKQVSNLQDKGRVNQSLMLFGYGDGGGGPNEDMLLRQQILADVDGIPKIKMGVPSDIFEHLESRVDKLCTWKGELYLELHNGTYTTQAWTKRLNRRCEFLLRDLEWLVSICHAMGKLHDLAKTKGEIYNVWKTVLLNQFHDVLPGTCIGLAHREVEKLYQSSMAKLQDMLKLVLFQFQSSDDLNSSVTLGVFNSFSWDSDQLVPVPMALFNNYLKNDMKGKNIQVLRNKESEYVLVPVKVPSMGFASVKQSFINTDSVVLEQHGGDSPSYIIRNKFISATINSRGQLKSLKCADNQREAIAPESSANQFVIFDDIPLYWDAWDVMDYHLETRRDAVMNVVREVSVVDKGPLRVSLEYQVHVGNNSVLTQTISLESDSPYLKFETEVDWNENHKFLKVEFPVTVHSQNATYEMQFGHLERPTHFNTSWDWARFEVCGHKWMDLSEYGFGVALLNDCKYGHSVRGSVMTMSLLRSPKSPDENADMGQHSFTYAVMPHTGSFQEAEVIRRAYELNSPLILSEIPQGKKSWFQVSNPAIIIETLKISESNDKKLILRLYESFGGHSDTIVNTCLPVVQVQICNALENVEHGDKNPVSCTFTPSLSMEMSFKPFQIISVCLTLS